MKGHILIMLANILFGASMPVFKYLLTADVPPEAITIMRAIFACMMFWLVSFFMPKEKVLPKDLCLLFVCALCGVGINQWLFVIGLKNSSPVNASIIATAVPIFVLLLAALVLKEPLSATSYEDYRKEIIRRIFGCERWAATSVQFYAND